MANSRMMMGLILSSLLANCGKEDYSANSKVGFLFPVTITPSRQTMQRGDTLWLEADFSDSLMDKNSGRRYRVRPQDLKFTSYIAYKQLQGVGQLPAGVAQSFRVVEKVGRAPVGGATTGIFEPVHDGHRYRARIGLIPTQAGVIAIAMSPVPEGGLKSQPLPFIQPPAVNGKQGRAFLDNSFFIINEGKANNFDLYRQHNKAWASEPGAPENTIIYETKSTFTVEVK